MALNSKWRHHVPIRKYLKSNALKRFKKRTRSYELPKQPLRQTKLCHKCSNRCQQKYIAVQPGLQEDGLGTALSPEVSAWHGQWLLAATNTMLSGWSLLAEHARSCFLLGEGRGKGRTESTCSTSKETELLGHVTSLAWVPSLSTAFYLTTQKTFVRAY